MCGASDYYRFVPPMENPTNSNDTGYSLHDRKPKVTVDRDNTISVSLRRTNSVNYAPMLDSASEECDEPKKNTPNKTRPKPDSPSTAVLNAHAQIQNKRHKILKLSQYLPYQFEINKQVNQKQGQQMWKLRTLWKHPLLWKLLRLITVKLNRMGTLNRSRRIRNL